jgi:hypothetical protein
MLGTRRAHVNDNIRTEHLKCSGCKTQIYLVRIESDNDGSEIRTFGCPHCAQCRSIRLSPRQDRCRSAETWPAFGQSIC